MQINKVVNRINQLLAGEMYDYTYFESLLDETIDDINDALNTIYPCFSDVVALGFSEYNLFPERYIRNVVIKGAAHKFYTMDEEGINSAEQYGFEFQKALFIMLRDFSDKVPEKYRSTNTGGVDINLESGLPGWSTFYPTGGGIPIYTDNLLPTVIKTYEVELDAVVEDTTLIITEEEAQQVT